MGLALKGLILEVLLGDNYLNDAGIFFIGTTARVGIQIFGTSCATKVRVIKTDNSFQRNAVDIFRISVDKR